MKSFSFILGLVMLACSVYCDDCGEDAGKRCILPLIESLHAFDIDCEAMIETKYCFKGFSIRCVASEQERKIVHDIVEKLEEKVVKLCDEAPEQNILECVAENTPNAMTACGKQIAEEQSNIQSDDEQDAKCITFLRVAECASNKIADICNPGIAEYLQNGMILGLKSSKIGKQVESPRCFAALENAEALAAPEFKK